MNELRNRGVEDILIGVVDGLKGFPEAITHGLPLGERADDARQIGITIPADVRRSARSRSTWNSMVLSDYTRLLLWGHRKRKLTVRRSRAAILCFSNLRAFVTSTRGSFGGTDKCSASRPSKLDSSRLLPRNYGKRH